ncbi:MAG: PQQ-like beta-propeller repeat protein [Caldiserica bacterium]|nr:PQQ-like beta-propeller repeat protein [Caldisericota bacterium]
MKILLAIVIMLSNFVFLPKGNTGSFKLKKVGEHSYPVTHESQDTQVVFGNILIKTTGEYWENQKLHLTAINLNSNTVLWERTLDNYDMTGISSKDGRLFVTNTQFARDAFNSVSENGNSDWDSRLYCLDLQTGKIIWSKCYGLKFIIRGCVPIPIEKYVYSCFGNTFYCFDAANGDVEWSYNCKTKASTSFNNLRWVSESLNTTDNASISYDNETRDEIIAFGGKNEAYYTPDFFDIYMFQRSNGKMKWIFNRSNENHTYEGGTTFSSFRLLGFAQRQNNIFIAGLEGKKYDYSDALFTIKSLDRSTGKVVWQKPLQNMLKISNDCFAIPVFCAGNGYILSKSNNYNIYNIHNSANGQLIKTLKTSSTVIQSKTLDQIYIINYKGVEAVKALTGKRLWYKKMTLCSSENSQRYNYNSVVLEKDNKLFILTEQGLTCIDATNGKTLDSWNYKVTPKSVFSAGKNLVACEIVNTEGSPTVLLFEY